MKTRIWLSLFMILLLTGAALAQRPGNRPGGEGPRGPQGMQTLSGSILEVNIAQRYIKVALRVRVTDPNAPGKVPDELAQKAAVLAQELQQAEKRGRTERAEQLRHLISKLLSWREVQQTITAQDHVMLLGSRQVPMTAVIPGMRIGVPVRVEGDLREGEVPPRATLIADALILNGEERNASVHVQGRSSGKAPVTFLQIVGVVASVNPLTVKVNDASVVIDTPQQFGARQNVAVTPKDLRPGLPLFAQVQMREETEIARILQINVLFFQTKTPLPPDVVEVQ